MGGWVGQGWGGAGLGWGRVGVRMALGWACRFLIQQYFRGVSNWALVDIFPLDCSPPFSLHWSCSECRSVGHAENGPRNKTGETFLLSPRSPRGLRFRTRYTISGGKRGITCSLSFLCAAAFFLQEFTIEVLLAFAFAQGVCLFVRSLVCLFVLALLALQELVSKQEQQRRGHLLCLPACADSSSSWIFLVICSVQRTTCSWDGSWTVDFMNTCASLMRFTASWSMCSSYDSAWLLTVGIKRNVLSHWVSKCCEGVTGAKTSNDLLQTLCFYY